MKNFSLLLVDDDVELSALMAEYFREQEIELAVANDGVGGLNRALDGSFDLILLDVMMPGMEGFEVLRQLRRRSAKPFSPDELLARIQAVLRRAGRGAALKSEILEANGVRMNAGTRLVTCEGSPVDVTSIEFDILELLVRSAGRVVSRDDLTRFLYNRQANPMERALDVHMSHLRKKLEQGRTLIRTVRGVGYLFASEDETKAEVANGV